MFTHIKKIIVKKNYRALLFFFLFISSVGFIQTNIAVAVQPLNAVPDETGADVQRKLKTAAVQHELILLLIENKTYDQVEPEWKKVLDLRLGAKFEGPIAQSLLTIGYKLFEAKQFILAQRIMDSSLAAPIPFSNANKADIYTFKAALCKELGDVDNAIRFYRLAKELTDK